MQQSLHFEIENDIIKTMSIHVKASAGEMLFHV